MPGPKIALVQIQQVAALSDECDVITTLIERMLMSSGKNSVPENRCHGVLVRVNPLD